MEAMELYLSTQLSLTTRSTTSLNPITSPTSATLSDAATLNCREPANSMTDLANDGDITAAEMPLSTFAPSTYTDFFWDLDLSESSQRIIETSSSSESGQENKAIASQMVCIKEESAIENTLHTMRTGVNQHPAPPLRQDTKESATKLVEGRCSSSVHRNSVSDWTDGESVNQHPAPSSRQDTKEIATKMVEGRCSS
ncbi:hypothetical protein GN958_ATG21533, partial [Phytophthora infestans]